MNTLFMWFGYKAKVNLGLLRGDRTLNLWWLLGRLHQLVLFHFSFYLVQFLHLKKKGIVYRPSTLEITMLLQSLSLFGRPAGLPGTLVLWHLHDKGTPQLACWPPEGYKCHTDGRQTAWTRLNLHQPTPPDLQVREKSIHEFCDKPLNAGGFS